MGDDQVRRAEERRSLTSERPHARVGMELTDHGGKLVALASFVDRCFDFHLAPGPLVGIEIASLDDENAPGGLRARHERQRTSCSGRLTERIRKERGRTPASDLRGPASATARIRWATHRA